MNERIYRILNHPMRVPVLVGVVTSASSGVAGYFLGRRSISYGTHEMPTPLETQLEMDLPERIYVEQHRDLPEPVVLATPALRFDEEADAAVTDVGGEFVNKLLGTGQDESSSEPDPEVELERRSVFAGNDDDWNYEAETSTRTEAEPHVIHRDEFFADEKDYAQLTLTYYVGDNIMADDAETPVYNFEQLTGPLKFGHGSGDPNVFYVRNDKRKAEYEVVRHEGLFSVEVLGLEIEDNARSQDIRHSDKFRPTD